MDLQNFKFELSQKYKISEEKIDDSLLPVFLATEYTQETNKDLIEKIKGNITTNHYNLHGLSSWKLLQFRWGWSWAVLFGLIILIGAYLYRTEPKTVIPQELSVIEKRGNKLFISADNYQVSKTEKGIYIKLKDSN